jgi:hypothetical protein
MDAQFTSTLAVWMLAGLATGWLISAFRSAR